MKKRLECKLIENGTKLELRGVDENRQPFHLFKQIDITGLAKHGVRQTFPSRVQAKQPYKVTLPEKQRPSTLDIELQFMGHYQEKNIKLKIDLD